MKKFCSIAIVFIMVTAVSLFSQTNLYTWGQNSSGQLGDGTNVQRNTPTQIGDDVNWISISGGIYHTFGIKSDGTLWAWGGNEAGQLGRGNVIGSNTPIQVGTENTWASVSCGYGHTLAIKQNGTLWACGYNGFGQVGDGTLINRTSFVQIGTANNWSQVSGGGYHNLAIKTDGTLWAWGDNQYGQLGRGNNNNSSTPVQIGTANDWIMVSAGESYSHALKSDGTLWACGGNTAGQLGDGTNMNRNVFVQVGSDNDWYYIYDGGGFTTAIKENHTLWTWGGNNAGQLGDGTHIWRNYPMQIGTDTDWLITNCGEQFALALKEDGSLWSWGCNLYTQLGDGTTAIDRNYPLQIGLTNNWGNIACGGFHSIALTSQLNPPILSSPENNEIDLPVSPICRWSDVINATSYKLEISTDNNFSNIVLSEEGIVNNYFQVEGLNYNTDYFWRVCAENSNMISNWSEVWKFSTEKKYMNILLKAGWNLISTNVIPDNLNIVNVFESVTSNIKLVKNGVGEIYDPIWEINTIGDLNIDDGYMVYALNSCILTVAGTEVIPENHTIYLSEGWNLISYLRNSPISASIFSQLGNSLIVVKNRLGQIYDPKWGVNTIGDLIPGQGYWIYLSEPVEFTYPAN